MIKTLRNFNSGSGQCIRYMWNSWFFLLWPYVSLLFYEDLDCSLKLVNKLTSDHINLTSYSFRRLKLPAQVLSETVGNVLNSFGPEETAGTAKFCIMVDKSFDCLNVRTTTDHITKRKPFLKAYYSIDDASFEWLHEFIQYFKLWKESIEERNDANYTENAKSQMFISWQSYERLQITVCHLKRFVNFYQNMVFPIFFQKDFPKMM